MRLQRRTKLLTGAAIALGLVIPAAGTLASPSTGSGQASTATVAPTTTTVKASTTTTVKGSTPTTTKTTPTTTKSTTAPKTKAKTAVTANHFRVVAGAFPTRAQANKQVARIKRAGQSGFVVVKSGKFFVVEDRGLAKAAAVRIVKALKAKGLAASVKG